MRGNGISLLLFIAVLVACAPLEQAPAEETGIAMEEPSATDESSQQALDQLREDYIAAYNSGNAAEVAEFYTEDAVAVGTGQALTGRQAIQEEVQRIFDQNNVQISISSEAGEVAGDWAWGAGTVTVSVTPKAGGETMESTSHSIVIFTRQAGAWKIARVVSSAPQQQQG
ncbi:MAG: YybH family protein [Acidobacteriota bacterium]